MCITDAYFMHAMHELRGAGEGCCGRKCGKRMIYKCKIYVIMVKK